MPYPLYTDTENEFIRSALDLQRNPNSMAAADRLMTAVKSMVTPQAPWGALALTATASGKRINLGAASAVSLTAGTAGTVALRFTDASGAIAVATTDANVSVSSTYVDVPVPSGKPFMEYIRVGGADVNFTATLLRV